MKKLVLGLMLVSSIEALASTNDNLLDAQNGEPSIEQLLPYDYNQFTQPRLKSFAQYRQLAPYRNESADISVEVADVTQEYEDKRRLEMAAQPRVMRQMGVNGLAHLATARIAVDQVDHIVDKVINIGQKIWTVVAKAKGVQNFNLTKATALPQNAKSWEELENWKQPVSRVIRVRYVDNIVKKEIIRFDYRIILLAGGSSNGVGQYIGYAAVKVEDAYAMPFNTFDAQVTVESVYNKGTKQNPVAGMILVVDWSLSFFGKPSRASHTFYLDGTGRIDTAKSTELP